MDICGGGVSLWVSNIMNEKENLQNELNKEIDRLGKFLQKSYNHRIKMLSQGKIDKVILCEIGSCVSSGRNDLIVNLIERQQRINHLTQKIEEISYSDTFKSEEDALPIEISKDSTLNSKGDEQGIAQGTK